MAHKRNPWNFENVISMHKQVVGQQVNASLNITSEHQRDLTDSASARFYGVIFASVASMAKRLDKVMSKIEVDADNMQRNLYMSGGAIAAEPLYLLLEKYGHTTAHEASKAVAHQALEQNKPLYEVAAAQADLKPYLDKFTDDECQILQEPEKYYTGLASTKANSIYEYWNNKIGNP